MAHLDEHKLLSDRQHAFRKRYSCETQLITVINDWAKILDNGGQVDTFILDFEKAFDTPPHEQLKCKLYGYGTGGKTLKWIDSFLCFRQQRVVVNGITTFQTPFANTDIYKRSFFPQTIRDWNSLTDTLLSAAEGAEDSVAKLTSLVRARD